MAKPDPNKTTAPANAAGADSFDTTAFVDLPIGFDPYWSPEVGGFVVANAEEFDARDPDFVRIRMRAAQPTKCFKGNVEDAEEVIVPAGGFFTVSTYAGITKELLYHVKSDIKPIIKLIAEKKTKVRTGRWAGKDAWVFRMQASAKDQAALASGRADFMKSLNPAPEREEATAS
jgi:hypothetical protein